MSDEERVTALDRFKRKEAVPSFAAQFEAPPSGQEGDDEQVEESRCYSRLRGGRGRLLMLDLRFRNGDRRAFGYSYLTDISFDASGLLALTFTGWVVTIEGARLLPIYQGLVDQAVGYMQELDEDTDRVKDGEPFIESIRVERVE